LAVIQGGVHFTVCGSTKCSYQWLIKGLGKLMQKVFVGVAP